ncbi:hypothetical protein THER_1696 [Thermodesulfovibrio sp. N1]|nr:hypothetical protein THER_1696 [Thermodesulfovibrio sp. N1]
MIILLKDCRKEIVNLKISENIPRKNKNVLIFIKIFTPYL